MKRKVVALTTNDNPYDPIDQFNEWFMFDVNHGYGTCEILDRFSYTTDSMTPPEIFEELNRAIDEIIQYDFECKYKKVIKEVEINEDK